VSLRGLPRAIWHAEIDAIGSELHEARGQLTVDGVTEDDIIEDEPLDDLTWSLE
jgi:hypothetical protein